MLTLLAAATLLSDGTDLDAWLAQVKSAGAKGRPALVAAIKKVDPGFDDSIIAESLETLDPSPFSRTDLFRTQLDADADLEVIAQIVSA